MVTRVSTRCEELIEHQRGVLARWQVANEPAHLAAVNAHLRSGKWQTVYRGVYASYTRSPSREGVLWVGVLRCGPDAALSHFTAAELDGLSAPARRHFHDHGHKCTYTGTKYP
jgi:hypothetical protein